MEKYQFKSEDFDGCGQYIVRTDEQFISNTGFLSTIMYKIGYSMGTKRDEFPSNIYSIISMSDGQIKEGYFSNTKNEKGESTNIDSWIWNSFSGDNNYEGRQKLCDYLNNGPYKKTFRFATNEELVRVANYQKTRTK